MSRRKVLLIALIVTLLGAGGWWITTHFEKVAVKHEEPPAQAARDNHYLALDRFMARMGRSMRTSDDVHLLDALKPGGVLLLDRHHRAALNKERLKKLFDWVGKGGYLIVVPEDSDEPDPVMSYLHVKWDDGADDACDDCDQPAAGDGKPSPTAASAPAASPRPAPLPLTASAPAVGTRPVTSPLTASAPAAAKTAASTAAPSPLTASSPTLAATPRPASASVAAALPASAPAAADDSAAANDSADDDEGDDSEADNTPRTFTATIPGSAHPLTIGMQDEGLQPGEIKPAWQVAMAAHSDWLIHYRYGLGNVTLIANLDHVLANDAIGDFDHAEFFWKLLQHFQPRGAVTLMTHLPIPDLFDWLITTAWTVTVSGLVLVALWLWSVAPRFGGTVPDVPPSRRELREHLNAVGRFVWRNEGLGRWLETARGAFRERLLLRHPAIAAMAPEQQAEALAQMTGLARQAIFTALTATPRHAFDFTTMLRTLKHLKHNL